MSELQPLSSLDVSRVQPRLFTVPILDAVTGGLPLGGSTLIAGSPGAGKSTLLLEAAVAVPWESFYFTGEERVEAVALRAARLGIRSDVLRVAATKSADEIAEAITLRRPALTVVDSIQTITVKRLWSDAGSPSQLRASAALIHDSAAQAGTAVVFVCHETKSGGFAGPRSVEHLVDVALHVERSPRRIVAVKNRFGSAPIEVDFELTGEGVRM
jgi:DNA repair protein RadA/Sms